MSTWMLVLGFIAVFVVGFLLGMKFMIGGFKKAIVDPDSPIRHLLDQEAEAFAKAAERRDYTSKCLLHCGEDIAAAIRDTIEKRKLR